MRRAAGAEVHALDLHEPHLPGEFLLAAEIESFQLLSSRQQGAHRHIAPHGAVGFELDRLDVLRRELAGKVERHGVLAHVEAHIVIAEQAVHCAGDYVLAGVRLHPRKAHVPVDGALNLCPRLERPGQDVGDVPVLRLRKARYAHPAQRAAVRFLASPAREKGRPLQPHVESVPALPTGDDAGNKVRRMSVGIIKPFGQIQHLKMAV